MSVIISKKPDLGLPFSELEEGVMYRHYKSTYETIYIRVGEVLIWFETKEKREGPYRDNRINCEYPTLTDLYEPSPIGTVLTIQP